jgi:NAD(P)-dependent dehydrogenase (short-subunit alcohol dehydrogenase family)
MVIDRHGHLDILINQAGTTVDKTIAKMSDDDWQRVLSVNLSGPFYLGDSKVRSISSSDFSRISTLRAFPLTVIGNSSTTCT